MEANGNCSVSAEQSSQSSAQLSAETQPSSMSLPSPALSSPSSSSSSSSSSSKKFQNSKILLPEVSPDETCRQSKKKTSRVHSKEYTNLPKLFEFLQSGTKCGLIEYDSPTTKSTPKRRRVYLSTTPDSNNNSNNKAAKPISSLEELLDISDQLLQGRFLNAVGQIETPKKKIRTKITKPVKLFAKKSF